ncbi:TPA: glycosyltransferase [Vibrio parahaemolyticus]|nr:glycosyltransferase [Vibrio parahaemolyticus]HCM1219920.1 glycosyltransferase [Vibrio parahaemolyticus]
MENNNIDILITSTLPFDRNNNSNIPVFAYEGFQELDNGMSIALCSLEYSSAQIKKCNPSYVLAIGSVAIDDVSYIDLRKSCDKVGAKLVFWLHDDPYEFDFAHKAERYADIILSNDINTVSFYNHDNVHFMPLGTSKENCYRDVTSDYRRFLSFFCGVGYPNRVRFFSEIDRKIEHCFKSKLYVCGDNWPNRFAFAENMRVTNSSFCNLVNNSYSVINLGRDFNIANKRYDLVQSTPGPRTFDTAMAGSMQIYLATDTLISSFYKEDEEILLIESSSDVRDIFQRIEDEPDWALGVAKRAQNATLEKHLYKHRALSILDIIL